MVKIEFEDEKLLMSLSGQNFMELVESCKYIGAQWNPKLKKWQIHAGKFDTVLHEFSTETIECSQYDKMKIKEYFDNLSSLKKNKRSELFEYHEELLNFLPKDAKPVEE